MKDRVAIKKNVKCTLMVESTKFLNDMASTSVVWHENMLKLSSHCQRRTWCESCVDLSCNSEFNRSSCIN